MTNTLFSMNYGQEANVESGDVLIITGESASGKTKTVLELTKTALLSKTHVLYITDELTPKEVLTRLSTAGEKMTGNHLVNFRYASQLDFTEVGKSAEESKNTATSLLVVIDTVKPHKLEDVVVLKELAVETGVAIAITTQVNKTTPSNFPPEDVNAKELGVKVIKTTRQSEVFKQEMLMD